MRATSTTFCERADERTSELDPKDEDLTLKVVLHITAILSLSLSLALFVFVRQIESQHRVCEIWKMLTCRYARNVFDVGVC